MSKYFFLLAFLIFMLKQDFVESECCRANCPGIGSFPFPSKCNDCTDPTPYCGYGPCNVFGCNCDGGCRTGSCGCERKRRDVEPVAEVTDATRVAHAQQVKINTKKHLDDIFENYDKNKNGVLEFSEVQDWGFERRNISKEDHGKMRLEVSKIDTDKDGKLTRHEINK